MCLMDLDRPIDIFLFVVGQCNDSQPSCVLLQMLLKLVIVFSSITFPSMLIDLLIRLPPGSITDAFSKHSILSIIKLIYQMNAQLYCKMLWNTQMCIMEGKSTQELETFRTYILLSIRNNMLLIRKCRVSSKDVQSVKQID